MCVLLSDECDVVRYVGGANFDRNTGRVGAGAFERCAKDEDGLSFTRRGIFSQDAEGDLSKIREVLGSRLKIGKTSVLAQLNCGKAVAVLKAEFDDKFSFIEDALPAQDENLANPAHALLLGLPFVGENVGALRSELAGDLLVNQIEQIFPSVIAEKI